MTPRETIDAYYVRANSGAWDSWCDLFTDDQVMDEQLAGHIETLATLRSMMKGMKKMYSKFQNVPKHILVAEKHDEIHIMRQTRFPIEHRGHAPADEVAHSQAVKRAHKKQAQLRFGHGERCGSLPARLGLQTNRHAGRAAKPPSTRARTNTDSRPTPVSFPASCGGTPRIVPGW